MNPILNLLFTSLMIMVLAHFLPGITVSGVMSAIAAAVVLAILNVVVRPIMVLLTFPVTILSFGSFLFVINAIMVMLVGVIVPGFHVSSFWWALLFSLLLSLIKTII